MIDGGLEICRLIAQKLWAVSSLIIFICFILYWFYGVLTALPLLIFGFVGMMYNAQDLFLYYPEMPSDSRVFVPQPSHYKLPYESIKVPSKDGFILHMFFLKQENSVQCPTFLYFHGNAGNMGHRLPNAKGLFYHLKVNILMIEYRGYGLSEGSPSEKGLYKDAQTAMEYLSHRKDIDHSKIIVFGRSLGGAVAIDLASHPDYKNKICSLIVENTFTSIPDMAFILLQWKWLRYLPLILHKNLYTSIKKVEKICVPSLFICGSNDCLVPSSMGEKLYLKCSSLRKKLLVITGGGHNDTWTCRDYYPSLSQFLDSIQSQTAVYFDTVAPYFDDPKICVLQPSKRSSIYTV